MAQWNEDIEKRILKKSRFTLTFRIIRILLLLWIIYLVYTMGLEFFTEKSHMGNEDAFYSSLALEWTVPNVRAELNFREDELTLFGSKDISYNLIKQVGEDEKLIGEASFTTRLFKDPSHLTISHPGYSRLSEFSFGLPEDPRTGKKLGGNAFSNVWETLDMLHKGTVGELAFSTTDFMKSTELLEALKDYDLHILWMPLYTGQFVTYEPESVSYSTDLIMPNDVIGLTGGMEHDERYHVNYRIRWFDEESLIESQQLMLKHMKEILNKPESYQHYFLRLGYLEEKYEFINNEGFIVYGAVVTGPVKELLKLKDLPFIQGEQLGEVELWNWNMN